MILAPAVLAALVVAWALGGDLRRLVELRFRATALIYGALGLQAVLFTPLFAPHPTAMRVGQLASYVLLGAFALRNRHQAGMLLIGLGIAANALAITVNGGFMPVDGAAAVASGWSLDVWAHGPYNNTELMDGSTRLAFLGDVFAVPHLPLAAALSIGDLLLVAGACVLFARQTAPAAPVASRGRLLRAPLRARPFRMLLAVQTTSALASWLTAAALIGWIYASDDGIWGSSAILLARGGAAALSSVLGGRLSDRVGRGRMLAGGELIQAASLVAIVLLGSGGPSPATYVLYVVASLAAAAAGPALRASVPQVVPSDDALNAANGVLGTARGAAMAVGALGGGLLSAAIGPRQVLLGAAAALVASGLGYAALRLRPGPASTAGERAGSPPRPPFRLRQHPAVWPILGMFGVATLGTGLLNAGLPGILDDAGAGATAYGIGLGTIGAGLLVGQLVSGAFRPGLIRPRTIAVALLLMALAAALVGATPLLATTLLALFGVGLFDGMTETIFDTLLQRSVPEAAHGAVFGLAEGLFTSTMLAGLGAAPLLSGHVAGSSISVLAGACLLSAGIVGLVVDAATSRRRGAAAAAASLA